MAIHWRKHIFPEKPANEDENFSITYSGDGKVFLRWDVNASEYYGVYVNEEEFTLLVGEYLRIRDAVHPTVM